MDIERLRLYCLSKPFATEDTPFGDENIIFRIYNKIFAAIDITRPERIVLKNVPERTSYLYTRYHSITGAWHWNKRHWIEVVFPGDATDALIFQLIDEAYAAVLHKFPKKQQIAHLESLIPQHVLFKHVNTCQSTNEDIFPIAQSAFESKHYKAVVLHSDLQRRGRGQQGTSWESQNGKNLTFSIAVKPTFLPLKNAFLLSQVVAIALHQSLSPVLNEQSHLLTIKWPNDIYYGNYKLSGTLIQNDITSQSVSLSTIGIGVNVNQQVFKSDAPNPISLYQILGYEVNRFLLLQSFLEHFLSLYADLEIAFQTANDDANDALKNHLSRIDTQYHQHLYRREGIHKFQQLAAGGNELGEPFQASIERVLPNGTLCLRTPDNHTHHFDFKEIKFVQEISDK